MDLILEAHSGLAGDMLIAALLDLGASQEQCEAELRKLNLTEPWTLEVARVSRHGIAANHVRFLSGGRPIEEPFLPSDSGKLVRAPGSAGAAHAHGRTYASIRSLIATSGLTERAKVRAQAAFRVLGEAEARLHGVSLDEVHFHEVGSLDAILDICGAAVLLELLGVARVYVPPLPVAHGQVKTAHGTLPLPAPATLEILKGMPLRETQLRFETVTPTGAALAAALSAGEPPPAYRIAKIGYGAGTKDPAEVANVLRVFALEPGAAQTETVTVLETTLDDATPEWLAALDDKLRAAGALDVFQTSVGMKKGRLGVNLTILARPADADRLTLLCFAESTTIGVRRRDETRTVLPRRMVRLATPWGEVDAKAVRLPDGSERATPEFESCRALAERAGVPLVDVYRAAAAAAVPP